MLGNVTLSPVSWGILPCTWVQCLEFLPALVFCCYVANCHKLGSVKSCTYHSCLSPWVRYPGVVKLCSLLGFSKGWDQAVIWLKRGSKGKIYGTKGPGTWVPGRCWLLAPGHSHPVCHEDLPAQVAHNSTALFFCIDGGTRNQARCLLQSQEP